MAKLLGLLFGSLTLSMTEIRLNMLFSPTLPEPGFLGPLTMANKKEFWVIDRRNGETLKAAPRRTNWLKAVSRAAAAYGRQPIKWHRILLLVMHKHTKEHTLGIIIRKETGGRMLAANKSLLIFFFNPISCQRGFWSPDSHGKLCHFDQKWAAGLKSSWQFVFRSWPRLDFIFSTIDY